MYNSPASAYFPQKAHLILLPQGDAGNPHQILDDKPF
jgi:hypothetical protein